MRITNELLNRDRKCSTVISNWLRNFVTSAAETLPAASTTLEYFWNFVLNIIEKEQQKLSKVKQKPKLYIFLFYFHELLSKLLLITLLFYFIRLKSFNI